MLEKQFPNNFHPNGDPILQSEAENQIRVDKESKLEEPQKNSTPEPKDEKEEDWDSKFE